MPIILDIQYDEKDKDRQHPLPDPRASQVLNTGFTAQSPMGRAKEIEAVSQHMSSLVSQIESKNEPQIAQAKEMIALETNEAVWPFVLSMIHKALPQPDPDMAKALAQGPQALKTLIQSNPAKYERPKRGEIYILSMHAEYSPGVMAEFKDAERAAPGGPGNPQPVAAEQPVDANLRGSSSRSCFAARTRANTSTSTRALWKS
jgi:hypothetical protein